MRVLPHILLGLTLATPAVALTPLPPCSGALINGSYEIWETQAQENGFVTYAAYDKTTRKAFVVLEHCKTGKALWADTFLGETRGQAGDLDDTFAVLDGYLGSDKRYSLKAIMRGMRRKDINVRQVRTKDESCACKAYFPDHRGSRKPFEF